MAKSCVDGTVVCLFKRGDTVRAGPVVSWHNNLSTVYLGYLIYPSTKVFSLVCAMFFNQQINSYLIFTYR